MPTTRKPFDKYAAYSQSVQSPREDARFLKQVYRDFSKAEPITLREDFCGAYALCCEWVKLDRTKRAIGFDLDPEPLAYGTNNYLSLLDDQQKARVSIHQRDVLIRSNIRTDVICAFNFSYFCFKSRDTLLKYFRSCRESLSKKGIFVVDAFGGPQCGEPSTDTKRLPGLTYYFEQETFDPINNTARFSIHFKPKAGRIRKRAFTYDWRMWSIPEIRDVMYDAGFKEVRVYWEGTAKNGRGSGRFTFKSRGEHCRVWVAYLAARV